MNSQIESVFLERHGHYPKEPHLPALQTQGEEAKPEEGPTRGSVEMTCERLSKFRLGDRMRRNHVYGSMN